MKNLNMKKRFWTKQRKVLFTRILCALLVFAMIIPMILSVVSVGAGL